MKAATNSTMADATRRVFAALSGVAGELIPGPFGDSDLQLSLRLSTDIPISVLPDADVPTLFEVVRLDTSALLADKLTSDRLIEVLGIWSRSPARA